MDQLFNHKHKIDFLLLNDTSLSQPTETIVKSKLNRCRECNKKRKPYDEILQIHYGIMKICWENGVCPYDQFKDIEFIAEGEFRKIYKVAWIDAQDIYEFSLKNRNGHSVSFIIIGDLGISKSATETTDEILKNIFGG
ncbi:hypothetical protein C1645_833706 [Glomus cerebriforme]|uniref:Uncharacterized protein n=1 Tax=Glomus cerebriforme TaxID=658196 RepID=A0A397SB44_9GLOM|nr:hypothetical protein C1645_833706 [Glomus cerebriforme]